MDIGVSTLETSYSLFSSFSNLSTHLVCFSIALRCVVITGFPSFSSNGINKMISNIKGSKGEC